ncbi:MAG: hypothetical protein P4L59_19525, partial [Desulfosporosinus sp.]|nr:hypothetical protein [Desulfosporosinus sp.]
IAIRLTLRLKSKTSGFSACAPLLAILATAASVHPWTSPVAFLHALSPALIDAIPLKCFTKLRNFLLVLGRRGLERRGSFCMQQGTVLRCISKMCVTCACMFDIYSPGPVLWNCLRR